MKFLASLLVSVVLVHGMFVLRAQSAEAVRGKAFADVADAALQVMTKRAEELRIKGVAVVAYFEGDSAQTWSSKMAVVGSLKNPPSGKDRGANLLAIAYTKAAEMADTLKDSGTSGRPPMTGETGWQGGLIQKSGKGYWIAAFSGGPSESDVKVSRAGLDSIKVSESLTH